MPIDNDITKCSNEDCPIKDQCLRWTIEEGVYQAYSELGPDEKDTDCKYFIQNNENNWEKRFDKVFSGEDGQWKEHLYPSDAKSFIKKLIQKEREESYEKGFSDGSDDVGEQAKVIEAESVHQAREDLKKELINWAGGNRFKRIVIYERLIDKINSL